MVYRFDQSASGTLSIKVGAGGAGASRGNANDSANGGDSTLVGEGLSITAYGGAGNLTILLISSQLVQLQK